MASSNMKLYIAPRFVKAIAEDARSTIIERTLRGEFLNSGADKEYSSNTLHVPRGAFNTESQNTHAFEQIKRSGAVGYYRMGSALWVAIEGGYRAVRQAKNLQTSHVDLSDTNQMLSGLQTIRADSESATLGWRDPELAERAYYHNVSGASKSRVIREFLGLTDEELDRITQRHLRRKIGVYINGQLTYFS